MQPQEVECKREAGAVAARRGHSRPGDPARVFLRVWHALNWQDPHRLRTFRACAQMAGEIREYHFDDAALQLRTPPVGAAAAAADPPPGDAAERHAPDRGQAARGGGGGGGGRGRPAMSADVCRWCPNERWHFLLTCTCRAYKPIPAVPVYCARSQRWVPADDASDARDSGARDPEADRAGEFDAGALDDPGFPPNSAHDEGWTADAANAEAVAALMCLSPSPPPPSSSPSPPPSPPSPPSPPPVPPPYPSASSACAGGHRVPAAPDFSGAGDGWLSDRPASAAGSAAGSRPIRVSWRARVHPP